MVESCCWCLDLERGSKVSAWISIMWKAAFMIIELHSYIPSFTLDGKNYALLEILDTVPYLVSGVLLLIGIYKKNAGLMLIALVSDIAMASPFLIVLIVGHIFQPQLHAYEFLVVFLILGLGVYAYMVIFSYLKQVVRNQDNRGIDIPYVGVI